MEYAIERLGVFLDTTSNLTIALLVVAAILLLLVARGVRVVPQGYAYTVERFGRYAHTLPPGLNMIVPFVDGIGHKVNMQEQVMDIPEQAAITKDNATVTIDAVVFFQVLDAARAAYEVRALDRSLINLAQTNMRTVVGSLDLDEVLSKRDEINARLLHTIDDASSPWGVKLTRVEIRDLVPPADILEAMGRQLKADRDRRAAILEAEGARQSAILRAEGQKQAAILEAEGRREAAFRDAEARERAAQAEAKATELVSAALGAGNVQAINYFIATKYLDALGRFATSSNQKLLVLPIEATGVLGALAGIVDITRTAAGEAARANPGTVIPRAG